MPTNSTPYEIVAAPFEVWVAPLATAFPDVADVPAGGWVKIGTSGARNITEDGVTIQHSQSVEKVRSLASTGPVKAFRTEEELLISFTLMDISLEQYSHALNSNTVTTVAPATGVGGYKKIGLSRGLSVTQKSLLVRGTACSPYGASWNVQYEVPIAVQQGEPEVVFVKGEPAGLALEWCALEDSTASETERFGRLVAQNAEPGV